MEQQLLQQEKKRDGWLDSCKAIAILLVILGHTYSIPEWLYVLIYAFHMPLFFIISGMVFNQQKYGRGTFGLYLRVKFKGYMVPYFGYAFFNLLLQVGYRFIFLREVVDLNYLLHHTKGILLCRATMETMPNCSPLWFLTCLFIAGLVFWAIVNYAEKYILIIAPLCGGVSYLMYLFVDRWLPWTLATVPMAVFFLCVGYELKRREVIRYLQRGRFKFVWLVFLTVVGIVAALWNGKTVGMSGNTYGNLILFLLSSIPLSCAFLGFCGVWRFLENRFLHWLGRNTLFIIAFNYFLRDLTTELYYLAPFVRTIPLCWEISFVLISCACFVGILCYNGAKRLLPFGKRRVRTNG